MVLAPTLASMGLGQILEEESAPCMGSLPPGATGVLEAVAAQGHVSIHSLTVQGRKPLHFKCTVGIVILPDTAAPGDAFAALEVSGDTLRLLAADPPVHPEA